MAILSPNPSSSSSSSSNLFLSLKISFISLTILSTAIVLKLYFVVACEYLFSQLPLLWISLQSWLTPPYLYVVMNFIIITIAASSRYQQKVTDDEQMETSTTTTTTTTTVIPESPLKIIQEMEFPPQVLNLAVDEAVIKNPVVVYRDVEVVNEVVEMESKEEQVEVVAAALEDYQIVIPNAKEIPNRTESMEIPMEYPFTKEKPPVSARFGHRKIAKGGTEGVKLLKVTKPKRQETLESTWKMITEGRSMPLARHLKKSDTWETTHTHSELPQERQVKKSETFNSNNNDSNVPSPPPPALTRSQGSGKLRKEPSLTQDDLNRRVEAFINKFNEEMRLQRLESLNRYKEMMGPEAL